MRFLFVFQRGVREILTAKSVICQKIHGVVPVRNMTYIFLLDAKDRHHHLENGRDEYLRLAWIYFGACLSEVRNFQYLPLQYPLRQILIKPDAVIELSWEIYFPRGILREK